MSAQEKPPAKLRSLVENHSYLLTAISGLIGILAPAGYIAGYTSHLVYLTNFGVSTDSFSLSTADAYIEAYYTAFTYLAEWLPRIFSTEGAKWLGIAILAFTTSIFTIFKTGRYYLEQQAAISYDKFPYWLIRYFSPENNDLSKVIFAVASLLFRVGTTIYISLVIILFWLGIPILSASKAEESATTRIEQYLQEGCTAQKTRKLSTCTKLVSRDNQVLAEGLLVAVSGNKAAFFTQKGSLILTIPSDAQLVRDLVPAAEKGTPEKPTAGSSASKGKSA